MAYIEYGRPQKFFQGGKVCILLILFSLLTMQCYWTLTKRITLLSPQKEYPTLPQQSQKILLFHSYFFPDSIKLRVLHYQQSLSRCITCQRCLCATVTLLT